MHYAYDKLGIQKYFKLFWTLTERGMYFMTDDFSLVGWMWKRKCWIFNFSFCKVKNLPWGHRFMGILMWMDSFYIIQQIREPKTSLQINSLIGKIKCKESVFCYNTIALIVQEGKSPTHFYLAHLFVCISIHTNICVINCSCHSIA